MAEENPTEISEIAKSIAIIVDKVPVYEDAVQPAAKQLGKSFELIAKAFHSALKPLEAWIWSIEKLTEFVTENVGKKLESVPPENIRQPSAHVAIPLLEALRYTGNDPDLSNMYANLLANAMDVETSSRAHPSFVEIIKNMTSDEARILSYLASNQTWLPYAVLDLQVITGKKFSFKTFSNHVSFVNFQRNLSNIGFDASCKKPMSAPLYIDNLERMGLVVTKRGLGEVGSDLYEKIEQVFVSPLRDELRKELRDGMELKTARGTLELTELGKEFVKMCVRDKSAELINSTTS